MKRTNITGEGGSFSPGNTGKAEVQPQALLNHFFGAHGERQQQQAPQAKKERSLPKNPELNADPGAEIVAPSSNTLMATKPFVCEICSMGFQRNQNLQLHRRGHNLPWWLLKPDYVHHNPKL